MAETFSAMAPVKVPDVATPAVASAAALSRSRRERSVMRSLGCGRRGSGGDQYVATHGRSRRSSSASSTRARTVCFAASRCTPLPPRRAGAAMSVAAPPATVAVASAPAPIDADERLHSLDILRGFALAGMILVHFHQRLERSVTGTEDLIGWGVWIFVEQKACGTFAFLFGVGFAVLLRRLEARGASVVAIYLRRLAALAAIGIIAQVALGFSILFEYACWGFVLLLIRRWPTRRLLVLAVVAACVRPIVAEASALYTWWTHAAASPAGPNLWAMGHDAEQLQHYSAVLAARWPMFVAGLPHGWRDL